MSIKAVFQYLARLHAWRIDLHAKVNVEIASISYVKISAQTNTATAYLSLAKKAVSM
jgi:hypothetical protein